MSMFDTREANAIHDWLDRLALFLPPFFEEHPPLAAFAERASILLHGSLTMGVVDEYADLDVWFLLSGDDLRTFRTVSEFTFFTFKLDGKKGHVSAHSVDELQERIGRCDMDLIFQMRRAEIIWDESERAARLIRLTRTPMRTEVRETLFFHHYVEMRSEHRACDTPIERNDGVALLMFLPKTLGHALRAAMVLDGEPYPYDKWLFRVAEKTPTGRKLAPHVERIMDLLAEDALRCSGPKEKNPISLELGAIRQVLINTARGKGLDSEWLETWWLYLEQAREARELVRW